MPDRAVSRMPSWTLVGGARSQSLTVCAPSHPAAGPWQFSQLTPSHVEGLRALISGETESAWQARHFWFWFGGDSKFRIFPMRSETSLRKHLVSPRMLVLPGPDAVLILGNTGDLFRLDAAMTTA